MTNMCTAFALVQVSGTSPWGLWVSSVSTMLKLIAQYNPIGGIAVIISIFQMRTPKFREAKPHI